MNVPAKCQAEPTQITGSFEETVKASFALNYYINIQGVWNKIRTNNEGRVFIFIALFSATHLIIL
jgi:hypothetical protein